MATKDPKKPEDSSDDACEPGAAAEAPPPVRIGVVRQKIGEGHDNLSRRGDWFSRRSSSKK
jgi:hypothetical protein